MATALHLECIRQTRNVAEFLLEELDRAGAAEMQLQLVAAAPCRFLLRALEHAGAFLVQCSWCSRLLDLKDGGGTSGISHTVCDDCETLVRKSFGLSPRRS